MIDFPLRTNAVRTPDTCFAHLPDYPWPANYPNDMPGVGLAWHMPPLNFSRLATPINDCLTTMQARQSLTQPAPQTRLWLRHALGRSRRFQTRGCFRF